MGYTIQAFIAKYAVFQTASLHSSTMLVKLPQEYTMLLLPDALRKRDEIPVLPFSDGGILRIPEGLEQLGCTRSEHGRVAYVEAAFWGGEGDQASLLWEHSVVIRELRVAQDAIHQALRMLGVVKTSTYDEFDALRLGTYRSTEKWMTETGTA